MSLHDHYMQRCLALARKGAGRVAPNPMVGAVLVCNDRIIGEGWHEVYGGPHAEVNCIQSVLENDKDLIEQSTLYVSLEPCNHYGKTPPCTDLILKYDIPKIVIACRDPFKEVNGKGTERLRDAGVEVITGILEKEAIDCNKRFFTFHTRQRPFIILKWAQTADGWMGKKAGDRLLISNEYTNRLVHQWRGEEAAILVGKQTALADNPALTNRLSPGANPIRLVIDRNLQLPAGLQIFDGAVKTIVFNTVKQEESEHLLFYKLGDEKNLLPQILKALYDLNILSVMVEGGAHTLQSFIDNNCWDEIRKIQSVSTVPELQNNDQGVPAPIIPNGIPVSHEKVATDSIDIYTNPQPHPISLIP
jgi:diaminohydroxyphosphoribosylaminopyrimidine deaminase / 5-amino-6-(5-phosphoribosylamino)uracil reductase